MKVDRRNIRQERSCLMASGVPGKRKVSLKEEGLIGGLRRDLGVPRGEMPKISKGYSKDHPAAVTMGRSDSLCPVALVSSAALSSIRAQQLRRQCREDQGSKVRAGATEVKVRRASQRCLMTSWKVVRAPKQESAEGLTGVRRRM